MKIDLVRDLFPSPVMVGGRRIDLYLRYIPSPIRDEDFFVSVFICCCSGIKLNDLEGEKTRSLIAICSIEWLVWYSLTLLWMLSHFISNVYLLHSSPCRDVLFYNSRDGCDSKHTSGMDNEQQVIEKGELQRGR